jgi:hypothetical protein
MDTRTTRGSEWAFFLVLFDIDIWSVMKKFMYVDKEKSNIYGYKMGFEK